jgi:StAR-related lipid transfer protein 7, mitochondrial
VRKYFDEFEIIDRLKKTKPSASATASMTAASCYSENEIDFDCMHNNNDDLDPWEFYVQKDNMITWRREESDGNYVYKGEQSINSCFLFLLINFSSVYVKYDDITAEDFLFVQTDVNYRREWDNTAVKLEIVDEDPYDDQQIIYWEMLWPRLFANRDYVSCVCYFHSPHSN